MRSWIKKNLSSLGSFLPFSHLVGWSGHGLLLPFYHSLQGKEALPHIHHLYRMRTIAGFEADLDFLLRHFRPVTLKELLEIARNDKLYKERVLHLTFDDGLREVYELAAPILERKGVPATIFLNTAFVDNRDLFFRYKAGLLVEALSEKSFSAAVLSKLKQIVKAGKWLPLNSQKTFKNVILRIKYPQRTVLDELAHMLEVDFDRFLKTNRPYLTKAQIRSLQARGFTIGAHSVDHPLFSDLSLDDQLWQTKESLRFVREHFNPEISAFSFPFTDYGVRPAFFEAIYRDNLVDLSFGCAGLKKEGYRFHLQRVPMEESPQRAAHLIKGEYTYYFLKKLLGRNKIFR